jgi:transposase
LFSRTFSFCCKRKSATFGAILAAPRALPDLATLDPYELKILILTQHEQLLSRDIEIEHLQLLLAKLRRIQFGRKSEKLDREIEQLGLRLDELEATQAEKAAPSQTSAAAVPAGNAVKPARRPLPEPITPKVADFLLQQNENVRENKK